MVEVVDARGAAGSGAAADDAFDHSRVALAKDHNGLFEGDERVDHLPRPGQQWQLPIAFHKGDSGADAARARAFGLSHIGRLQERTRPLNIVRIPRLEALPFVGARGVATRRSLSVESVGDLARLDPAAIEQVRNEARPLVRSADELHDLLLTRIAVFDDERLEKWNPWYTELERNNRATTMVLNDGAAWIAAERLPAAMSVYSSDGFQPSPRARTCAPVPTSPRDHVEDRGYELGQRGTTRAETAGSRHYSSD